jgi:hypothetical protein
MDAALRKAMRSAQKPHTGCDAELAAAYAEGRLKAGERERFEGHIAECTACRALTTAMLEELAPAAASPPRVPALWWRWQWAVPAMAGIVIVGSAVIYQQTRMEAPKTQMAVDRLETRSNVAPAEVPAAKPAPADRERAAARRSVAPATPARELKDDAVNRRDELAVATEPARQKQEQEQFVTAPVSVAQAPASGFKEKGADVREYDKKVVGAVVGGVAGPAKEEFTGARRQQLQKLQQAAAGAYALPDAAPLRAFTASGDRIWAVSDGGRIFRSTDGGKTWQKLESPATEDLVSVTLESETSLVVTDRKGNQHRLRP